MLALTWSSASRKRASLMARSSLFGLRQHRDQRTVDGLDHVQQRDVLRLAFERIAAVDAARGVQNSVRHQAAQNLQQESLRHVAVGSQLAARHRSAGVGLRQLEALRARRTRRCGRASLRSCRVGGCGGAAADVRRQNAYARRAGKLVQARSCARTSDNAKFVKHRGRKKVSLQFRLSELFRRRHFAVANTRRVSLVVGAKLSDERLNVKNIASRTRILHTRAK